MAKLHHLGFPRIGNKRQLKFAVALSRSPAALRPMGTRVRVRPEK